MAPRRRGHSTRAYLPFVWRGWTDFGCGALGDMGCYSFDTIYRALELTAPVAAQATGSDRSPGDLPDVLDGPPRIPGPGRETAGGGHLVRRRAEAPEAPGDRGRQAAPLGGHHLLRSRRIAPLRFQRRARGDLPKSRRGSFVEPPKTLPRSPGNEREWLDAIHDSKVRTAQLRILGRVTEALHLGNIALRTGERVTWDSAAMALGGTSSARALVRPDYRPGWEV